jgi:2-hydroxychromene-2-carboxylate isomerase
VSEGPRGPGGQPVFYYDTNSPYAYLAATRIDELIPDAVWRPLPLGILFRQLGKVPWSLQEDRERGMAECERRARERGLPPLRWPEGWPAGTWSFKPLRAAIVADDHGLQREFALECFQLMFAECRSLDDLDTVLEAARAAGLDPDAVRERLEDPEVKDRLRSYTEEAIELGVTGVPTVALGERLFWGDDRLEEAAAATA